MTGATTAVFVAARHGRTCSGHGRPPPAGPRAPGATLEQACRPRSVGRDPGARATLPRLPSWADHDANRSSVHDPSPLTNARAGHSDVEEEPASALVTRRESVEKPGRADGVRAGVMDTATQRPVRGDEQNRSGCSRRHGGERVVPAARGVNDLHAVDDPLLDAATCCALQDHHDGTRQPTRGRRSTNALHELAGGSRPVPPPTGRAGADDICRINEEHRDRVGSWSPGARALPASRAGGACSPAVAEGSHSRGGHRHDQGVGIRALEPERSFGRGRRRSGTVA